VSTIWLLAVYKTYAPLGLYDGELGVSRGWVRRVRVRVQSWRPALRVSKKTPELNAEPASAQHYGRLDRSSALRRTTEFRTALGVKIGLVVQWSHRVNNRLAMDGATAPQTSNNQNQILISSSLTALGNSTPPSVMIPEMR